MSEIEEEHCTENVRHSKVQGHTNGVVLFIQRVSEPVSPNRRTDVEEISTVNTAWKGMDL